ncbi:MAG TPA: redox-regulated ATPase YchF [Candidatus Magasanikbacteria bacterium]|nr:redox-regulated ATPase YchF [Candidatus Magasanikbacteria bacterium]
MSLSIGIVGLPNVGKSTLFKALTKKQALIANYPFATIDPNVGVVEVPDNRLKPLAEVSHSAKIVPTTIEFVDIAGLVRGASQGEGLGNKFLSHIREVAAIVQVVRGFSDPDVIHVQGQVNPNSDLEIINLELALADLETAQKHLGELKSRAKSGGNLLLEQETKLFEKLLAALTEGRALRDLSLTDDEKKQIKSFSFLTLKPMIMVLNVDEPDKIKNQGQNQLNFSGPIIEISAKLEAELADLSLEEAQEYMNTLGLQQTGLDKLILAGYNILNLITFLTSGEMETKAWTVAKGAKAPQAAGVIHTDFEKSFIRAEVCDWQDFVQFGGWSKIKESGKMHLEGKDYLMQDGDVVYFHTGA